MACVLSSNVIKDMGFHRFPFGRTGMISIPVSFLLAALLLGLLLSVPFWRGVPVGARICFAALLVFLCLEAVLVGVRFAFGVFDFLPLQRILPIWIAPLAYLSFLALSEPLAGLKAPGAILFGLAITASGLVLLPLQLPGLMDAVIGLSVLSCSFLLARHWLRGPDELSQIPVRLTGRWHQIEAAALATMIATLIVDTAIAFLFARSEEHAAAWLVSLATLSLIAALTGFLIWLNLGSAVGRRTHLHPASKEAADAIMEKVGAILVEQGLFRDTGLTATRLARRVGVPDRDLSRAINTGKGQSVSQFVNQLRVEEAARLLISTDDPATQIMENAGFLTRSNFYREFQKHYGMPPGDYRKKMRDAG
jgi:AraC-like DNA-binding protein